MSELKAYSCMETHEYMGAIIFAKSNIEARRLSANEYNDGELGGMTVTRAPWADKYGSGANIPVSDMIDHGWHFECYYSGIRIESEVYEYGHDVYNRETEKYEIDTSLIGKSPVGFQYGPVFACQEYADRYAVCKAVEKKFNNEQLEYWRSVVLKNFPDAVLMDQDGYMRNERITSFNMKTDDFTGDGPRYTYSVHIPFSFPGMKHWAALEFGQPNHGKYGPSHPSFTCANGDVEIFTTWSKEQKEKKNE